MNIQRTKNYIAISILLIAISACECLNERILQDLDCPKGPQHLVISEMKKGNPTEILTHISILGHGEFLCSHTGNALIVSAHGAPVLARWSSVRSIEVILPSGANVLFKADQARGIKIITKQQQPLTSGCTRLPGPHLRADLSAHTGPGRR
ncbi:MAG: hypothetical protein ABFD81_08970 [Syntrophaceae bacterium]